MPAVAKWCAEPIETGVPGFVLRPPVLGRAAVPVVADTAEAALRPEFGVLSAIAHGDTEYGATIAAAVLPVVQGLDDDRAKLYWDLVYNSLDEPARRSLEVTMGYEYQSDFAKKYVAEGRQQGEADFLLRLLEQKFGLLDPKTRSRVRSADAERLLDWGGRVLAAERLEDVFKN